MLNRRNFLKQLSIGTVSVLTSCNLNVNKKTPNIIVILADDLGYGDLGCYGCPDIKSPTIDKLASQGVKFTQYYANGPECTPTRAALLTGRYQHRVGGLECAIGVGNAGRYDDAVRLNKTKDLGLPVKENTIAKRLKEMGYNTAIIGKWHLGYEPKFSPNNHGFDYAFGPLGGAVDYFYHCEPDLKPNLYQNGEPIKRDGYLTDIITDEAIKFVEMQNESPFFLYLPYTVPHNPYQGPDDKIDESIYINNFVKSGQRKTFIKMVERFDQDLEKLFNILDKKGLSDNTLIVFTSDNGANGNGRNFPLSGHKGSVFEGGIRVPCIVKWPDVIKANTTSKQTCMTIDFTRSILKVAGVKNLNETEFDGIDILKHIQQNKKEIKRTLFWRIRRGNRTRKAVRHGDKKLIINKRGNETEEFLFDLKTDVEETNNLFESSPEQVKFLKNLLFSWEKKVQHQR